MKKKLCAILISVFCSNFIFAQFKTDISQVKKCLDSTKLQVCITKDNKSYYSNNQSKIHNILNNLDSLQGQTVVGHYHPDENYWTIDFTEITSSRKIKTLYYNDRWNSFMYSSQHFGMTNNDFEKKILKGLAEYDKLIYTCKSLSQYRNSVDFLNKKQNKNLYLQNAHNKVENLFYKNDNWGYYNFEIKNLDFVNYQTMTDSIQKLIQKSASNNDIKIFFNYPQLEGEISMEERISKNAKYRLENPKNYKPIQGEKQAGRPQYGISSKIMGNDVKHTILVNFSAECSSETAKKINIGIKKSEWQEIRKPNFTIELFTNKKEKLIEILNELK